MRPSLPLLAALLLEPLSALLRTRRTIQRIVLMFGFCLGLLIGDARAVTFKPRDVHQWDTWVFYHDKTYYLYYLIASQWQGWDGFGVATSKDGVHWEEQGTPVMKRANASWLGTGSTWKSPQFEKDRRFIVNFSEQPKGEAQHIYFAESRDLIKWDRLLVEFRQDSRWYDEKGRWDCIYSIPRPTGGFYGYWTATPKGRVSFGFGESEDGVNWRALEPPVLDWGAQAAPKACEIGAVERVGSRYYAMVGAYPEGMFSFVADHPQGPFVATPKNFRLLGGDCYFARFFPSPDGLLAIHHSVSTARRGRQNVVYTAPLKRALVDAEGTMRLGWWQGNEVLKGATTEVRLPARTKTGVNDMVFITDGVDVRRGTILEGAVDFSPGAGLVVESADGKLTAIRLPSATATEAGTIQADGTRFTVLTGQSINRGLPDKPSGQWRLLLRQGLVELYLDDVLFNVLSLPKAATGRVGFLGDASGIRNLKAWTMTLPDEPSPETQR